MRVRGKVIDEVKAVVKHPFEDFYHLSAEIQELLLLLGIVWILIDNWFVLDESPHICGPMVIRALITIVSRTVSADGLRRVTEGEETNFRVV